MEWAGKEHILHATWERTGIKPKSLETKPRLLPELEFAYSVFTDLRMGAVDSFSGELVILLSDFLAYAFLHQFTRLDAINTWYRVQMATQAWNTVVKNRRAAAKT